MLVIVAIITRQSCRQQEQYNTDRSAYTALYYISSLLTGQHHNASSRPKLCQWPAFNAQTLSVSHPVDSGSVRHHQFSSPFQPPPSVHTGRYQSSRSFKCAPRISSKTPVQHGLKRKAFTELAKGDPPEGPSFRRPNFPYQKT